MSTESLDRLSDVELHRQLIQNGFPSTPVTETTRALLLRKLKKHVKNEKLKKRKSSNYVLYTNDMNRSPAAQPWEQNQSPSPPLLQARPNINTYDNNNGINKSRNSAMFYNHNLDSDSDGSSPLQMSPPPRMYAPPPVLASDYENECEPISASSKYRKMCPITCPIDNVATNSYAKPNGIANASDGGVVNRLLSFRDTTIQRKYNSKGAYAVHVSKAQTQAQAPARIENVKRFALADLKSLFKKPELNQYIIPHVLIAALLIFLTIITVVYVAKRIDKSPLDQSNVMYTLCSQNNRDSALNGMCINSDMLSIALNMNEELFKYLNERAKQHHCTNENLSPVLDMKDFIKALSDNSHAFIANLQSKLLAVKYLIEQNPQWMIKMISPETEAESGNLLESSGNSLENLSFELMQPNLPLKCIILKKMTRFFTIIGSLILIILGCLTIYYLAVSYRKRQKERLCAADQLAKDIINELISQSQINSENAQMTIDELQDKLLPANRRSKLSFSWNKALKMLEENDSRVLFGMVFRNGEQLRTLTWNGSVESKDLSTTKKWQSPAFDNSNKIANPPTPCLKIRHMFDSLEVDHPNLRQLIVEAIFEKVGARCKICDIQLDTQSCCVYLRCASEADAGIVHNEINGWWFDKRLISIKFLRLERYLSRFPKPSTEPKYFLGPNVINNHNRS